MRHTFGVLNLLTYLMVDKSGSMEFEGAVIRTASKLEQVFKLTRRRGILAVTAIFWERTRVFGGRWICSGARALT
jgi:hypothetical protein